MAVNVYRTTSAVNESGTATFFATGLTAGTSYTPTFGGTAGAGVVAIGDIDASSKSGTGLKSVKADANGVAVFSIKLAQDAATEVTENFSIKVATTAAPSTILGTSGVIKVYDTSVTPENAVIPSALSVNEGLGVTFSISAPDGFYNYAFTGSSTVTTDYTVTSSATVNTTTSKVTVKNGVGSIIVKTVADSAIDTAGPETLILTLTGTTKLDGTTALDDQDSFEAATVTINDTSTGIPILTPSATSVNEGGSVSFALSNVAPGTYTYALSGSGTGSIATPVTTSATNSILADVTLSSGTTVNAAAVTAAAAAVGAGTKAAIAVGDLTGTITIASGKTSATLTVPVNGDNYTEGAEVLTLTLDTPNLTTTNAILAAAVNGLSSSVLINDTSKNYSYKLSPSKTTIDEGSAVVFSITDGKPGATVGYKIKDFTPSTTTDFSSTIALDDFTTTQGGTTNIPALTLNAGTAIIGADGKGSFSIFVKADTSYDGGGSTKLAEKFQVVLNDNTGTNTGTDITVVGTNLVTINDTSFA